MRELVLGDEAVALAAIDAGIGGAFSYPGTPATEIMECIQARTANLSIECQVVARWSANEKVAYEEALGMSFVGKRAIVSMKHVGLNVASDPFMSSALTGANGGLVVAVADDPGMHSSQNEQDTRFYGDFAQIPVFEPSNQQEAYDMTREAFELSERVGLPVLLRLVTRLSHSRAAIVRTSAGAETPARPSRGDPKNWTLLPVNARRRFRGLLDLQPALLEYSRRAVWNRLALHGPRGIIASGLAYNYVMEVLSAQSDEDSFSLLKISTYPLPVDLIRRIIDHCESVLIVEEGAPLIERKINGLFGLAKKDIRGKCSGHLPPDGEMTPERVQAALGWPALPTLNVEDSLPSRPPVLCNGCPHCDSFQAVLDALSGNHNPKPAFFSDIGCYSLGALPPFGIGDTCVDMGASIGMAIGAAKAGVHPVLCAIGDSTFTHSGMPALLQAAREDINITVIVLDNGAVAMTGGQDVFVTGDDLLTLIRGLGVSEEHLIQLDPHPKHHAKNVEIVQREVNHRGLSVIVASRPCIHTKRRTVESEKRDATAVAV